MTTEEKAKAYDEALERARANYKADKEMGFLENCDMLELIFPELAESEDERVIKALETFINQPEIADKITFEARIEWLAWLEKQKENPKSSDSIPSDCTSDAKCGNSRHKVGDTLESRKLADEVVAYLIKSGYQPIIKDTLDQKHFQIKIPRHKEDFFLSTEYKYCREILDEYYYEGDFAGDVYTLYVLKQKEQKPAWSEEDEEMLEYVIGDLNDAKQLFHAKDAIDLCDKEIAWLKSLRNRPTKSDTWKPSEMNTNCQGCLYYRNGCKLPKGLDCPEKKEEKK